MHANCHLHDDAARDASYDLVLRCITTTDVMQQSSIGVPCHHRKYGTTEGCLSRPAITLIEAPVEPLQPVVDQSARPLGHPAQPAVHRSLYIQRTLSCVQGKGA